MVEDCGSCGQMVALDGSQPAEQRVECTNVEKNAPRSTIEPGDAGMHGTRGAAARRGSQGLVRTSLSIGIYMVDGSHL